MPRRGWRRAGRLLALLAAAAFLAPADAAAQQSPITAEHLEALNGLFKQNGIAHGLAVRDSRGRIELKGEYENEAEVDRAFSLAQTLVGIRWISPVTPEGIRVKEWEKRLGGLFARARVLSAASAGEPPGPVRRRYALVAGIGEFLYGQSAANPRGITPLQFAARDAASFHRFLVDPRRGGFPAENVIFLTDRDATLANITAGLARIRERAEPDDLVAVYLSSHGTPPDKFGGVFVVAYDTQVQPREAVWRTAVSETLLRDFVENLRAKRLVMILDTCYSNGAYRAVPGFLPPGGKSLGAGEEEGYGLSAGFGRRLLGAKDLVAEGPSAPPAAAPGAAEGWGKVLIGASGAGERSWESDQLNNSIFTYYYLEGLNRGNGSVRQAFYHAKPLVSQRVKQEKGVDIDQTPQAMATQPNWEMRLAAR
jgi:hypothetical protein